MFFGKSTQTHITSPSSEVEVSTDNDWQHIPIDGDDEEKEENLGDAVPLLLDPSFEFVENESNYMGDLTEEHAEDTSQTEQILMTMEALVQNGRAPNDKWTTYLCLLSIAALLFGVGGGGGTKTTVKENLQVPQPIVVDDLVPYPLTVPRAGEPVLNPDAKFEGMKSHLIQEQQASPTVSPDYIAFVAAQQAREPDYASFVAAQKANPSPIHALSTKMGVNEEAVGKNNPRPTKPSAVPISEIQGTMKSRKRRFGQSSNPASIPSVEEPRPPEKYPEQDDKLRLLEKRIEELEEHNEDLLERFVRTAGNAADWKKKADSLNEALTTLKQDRDTLAEATEANKPLVNLSSPLDLLPRHSKKPMASNESTDEAMNATAPVSRRRDLRATSALPPEQGLVPASPTALIPSPA